MCKNSLALTEVPIAIETAYQKQIANNGAVMIDAPVNRAAQDPLDLPPEQLKRIVRGIIWRNEHFSGAYIQGIARTSGHGENYVRRCVVDSLAFVV